MCSVASFDYVRREFGNQALDNPTAFYCIACIGGIRRPSWLTSFYLRLRQGRCVVIKCTQPTATDTILYTPTQYFLSVLLRAAAQIFETGEGRPYLHRSELLCGIISLMDIDARSDLWAVGSVTVFAKKTTRPCSIRIQGTPGSLRNPSRSSGPGLERGRKSGPRIEVKRGEHGSSSSTPCAGQMCPPLAILGRATLVPWIHNLPAADS